MYILICEDEHFIRHALAEHLSLLGYQVSEAENGLECIELVSNTEPDLILMDLKMPELDGAKTIAKLKNMKIQSAIIILSGFGASDELAAEHICIAKPYRLSEVSNLIKTKFGHARPKNT
ncbi:MAG: response regulator [Deltaproteobacteria bacterium]|nr:response regulator [Deltaproteobacteria bacterium]